MRVKSTHRTNSIHQVSCAPSRRFTCVKFFIFGGHHWSAGAFSTQNMNENSYPSTVIIDYNTLWQFPLLTFKVSRAGDRQYVRMIWLQFTVDPYFIGWVFLFLYDRCTSFRFLKPPTERTQELSCTSTVSRTYFPSFWSSNTIIRSNKPRTADIPVFNPLGSS